MYFFSQNCCNDFPLPFVVPEDSIGLQALFNVPPLMDYFVGGFFEKEPKKTTKFSICLEFFQLVMTIWTLKNPAVVDLKWFLDNLRKDPDVRVL